MRGAPHKREDWGKDMKSLWEADKFSLGKVQTRKRKTMSVCSEVSTEVPRNKVFPDVIKDSLDKTWGFTSS